MLARCLQNQRWSKLSPFWRPNQHLKCSIFETDFKFSGWRLLLYCTQVVFGTVWQLSISHFFDPESACYCVDLGGDFWWSLADLKLQPLWPQIRMLFHQFNGFFWWDGRRGGPGRGAKRLENVGKRPIGRWRCQSVGNYCYGWGPFPPFVAVIASALACSLACFSIFCVSPNLILAPEGSRFSRKPNS